MIIPDEVVRAITAARHVCVLTGAGASAESGVPTFRDALTGLWEKFDPLELATPEAFRREPELVWGWYVWRRELVSRVEPNAGHTALVALAKLVPEFTLITQNVDGLHQRAGQRDVIEYHGNLFDNRCFEHKCDISAADLTVKSPQCPNCGGKIRPGVVWFGEAIPQQAMDAAALAAEDCDVFISIGTSALVWPAAGLAETALHNQAVVVEINPDPTPQSNAIQHRMTATSATALPQIVDECRSFMESN